MEKRRENLSRRMSFLGIATALVYVATSISTPMPKPLGVWHMGDIASFIIAILFGPFIGALACGVGAMLFDIWNPLWGSSYIMWAPATLVIRGIMGFLAGKMRRIMPKKPRFSELVAMAVASTQKNLCYFLYDYTLFGPAAILDLVTFFPKSAITIAVVIPLLSSIRRILRVEYIIS